ncbi:MAG: hypothetical protein AAFV25_12070 [Bacteroidota bacterium]
MNIDIAASIGKLLYEKDQVVISDFGGFVANYKPSVIDHVQGLLHPPSKQISFDRDLQTDDGQLLQFLCDTTGIDKEEARQLIEDFSKQTLEALHRREIVVFPNVGRLYMDYESNFQFLQDSTNFNTASFGLPTVQFYPILRTLNEANIHAPLPKDKWVELPKREAKPRLKLPSMPPVRKLLRRQGSTAAVGLVLLVAAVSIFYFALQGKADILGIQKVPVADKRLNTKPYQGQEQEFEAGILSGVGEATTSQPQKNEDGEFETSIDTESITTAPNQKEAVIIIGAFGKKAGVRKRIQQIYEMGFDAYQDKVNGLTRVGIQFLYEEEPEVDKTLRLMRRKFDKSAYILD